MYCGAVEFVCSPTAVTHIPVLLDECLAALEPGHGGSFADLTFGGGGHSRAILEASIESNLLAMDCLLYTSPSPRDAHESRMPSSA